MSDLMRSPMSVSFRWLQAVILTFLVGFAVLGYLALRVYQDHAPIPGQGRSENGRDLLHRRGHPSGQELFLTYGLMEYGSVYGHGAYLGPDFTADYLHRQALEMQQLYGGGADGRRSGSASELQANRYDPATATL